MALINPEGTHDYIHWQDRFTGPLDNPATIPRWMQVTLLIKSRALGGANGFATAII